MKTATHSLSIPVAICTALFLLITGVAFGSDLELNNYNEDTPPELIVEDEEYIDDIPFDTEAVAEAFLLNETMNVAFDFEEEAYIDDIPCNTYKVVKNYRYEKYLENVFVFEEEEYIDDIPFNTEKIFNEVFFTVVYYSK